MEAALISRSLVSLVVVLSLGRVARARLHLLLRWLSVVHWIAIGELNAPEPSWFREEHVCGSS